MEVALPHSSRIKTEAAFKSLKLSTKSFLWNKWKRQRKVSYHRAVLGLQMHKALVSLSVCYVTLCRSVVQVFKNIQYVVIQSRRTFVLSDKNMVLVWEASIQIRDSNVHWAFKGSVSCSIILCFTAFTWQQQYVFGLVASGLVQVWYVGKILNSLTIWTKEEVKRLKTGQLTH